MPHERCYHAGNMSGEAGLACPVTIYIGLGANLGDRMENIRQALVRLSKGVSIETLSSIYETEPWGYAEQPRFLNAVCRGLTHLDPRGVLSLAKEIELSLGRSTGFPNAPRPIDIDILLYDDIVVESPELTIPHPRLGERAFVMVPLVEIAPGLIHPLTGKTLREMLLDMGRVEGVTVWREEAKDV